MTLHLLDLDDLGAAEISQILNQAESFAPDGKLPSSQDDQLSDITVVNLFFEGSTRTRTTFELAAERLSATLINFDVATSSTSKGETLRDTLLTLRASSADIFVLRHGYSGAPRFVAEKVVPQAGLINAGDGSHAHPTQALLDLLTIRQLKGRCDNLTVAIVGDLLHSRVARSLIHGLHAMGTADIRACAPLTLLPDGLAQRGVKVCHRLEDAVRDADVVIALRLQRERMQTHRLPSTDEYFRHWGLTEQKLAGAKADAIVMHPGPINRGQDISSDLADGRRSAILRQIANGVAVRMAVLVRIAEAVRQQRSGSG